MSDIIDSNSSTSTVESCRSSKSILQLITWQVKKKEYQTQLISLILVQFVLRFFVSHCNYLANILFANYVWNELQKIVGVDVNYIL